MAGGARTAVMFADFASGVALLGLFGITTVVGDFGWFDGRRLGVFSAGFSAGFSRGFSLDFSASAVAPTSSGPWARDRWAEPRHRAHGWRVRSRRSLDRCNT